MNLLQSHMIHIKKTTSEDIDCIKTIMLFALKESPLAFSVTFNEYAHNSTFWWENYLRLYFEEQKGSMYLAFNDQDPVGIGGVQFNQRAKSNHIASIVWMYTSPEFRGQHIASCIFDNIMSDINSNEKIKKIALYVTASQESAIAMYQKHGFKEAGRQRQELLNNGVYYDLLTMEKYLETE